MGGPTEHKQSGCTSWTHQRGFRVHSGVPETRHLKDPHPSVPKLWDWQAVTPPLPHYGGQEKQRRRGPAPWLSRVQDQPSLPHPGFILHRPLGTASRQLDSPAVQGAGTKPSPRSSQLIDWPNLKPFQTPRTIATRLQLFINRKGNSWPLEGNQK